MINNEPATDGLIEHEVPQANLPTMLVAFAGWPDAAEAATRAMRFLVRKLRATKFAEIDHRKNSTISLTSGRSHA